MGWYRRVELWEVDVEEREGASARAVGKEDLVAEREAQRNDWKRAARIIVMTVV